MKNPKSCKGNLVLIGGAEDRNKEKAVLENLVGLNKAQKVVIIPTATLYPGECGEDYYYAFRDLGLKQIEVLDIRERKDAAENKNLKIIQDATLVFFTGGDQVRLTEILLDTPLINLIKQRFITQNLTIAGTSAGAAAAANPMTYDGDNSGLIKGSVKHSRGFGFIENITIDTHFVARGRLGRMTQFLCNGYTHKGIGIDENTSVTVQADDTFYVSGSGIVTVVSTENVHFSNFNQIRENEKISLDGIQLGFLQHGTTFDIKTWRTLH